MFINRRNRPPEFVLAHSTEAGDEFYVGSRGVAGGGKVAAEWTAEQARATRYSSKYTAKQARNRDGLGDCDPVKVLP